jgi:hypothetical protein
MTGRLAHWRWQESLAQHIRGVDLSWQIPPGQSFLKLMLGWLWLKKPHGYLSGYKPSIARFPLQWPAQLQLQFFRRPARMNPRAPKPRQTQPRAKATAMPQIGILFS